MVKIAPSLLSANFACLEKELVAIKEAGASWLHYDVMDGHFVPNISFGYGVLKDVDRVSDLFMDVHLMLTNPQDYVDNFIDAGADLITFHVEALNDENKIKELIDHLQTRGCKVGISLKPKTPIADILAYLERVDLVLVMSVEPGFGGQKFNPKAEEKIKALDKLRQDNEYGYLIEVDGGINQETGLICKEAGADVLVAGSYVFNNSDYREAVDSLR